jgi:hypothetical protein
VERTVAGSLPKGHKQHLTVEELSRNISYASEGIDVIP